MSYRNEVTEKLINDLTKCDGRNKNCKACMFREHPACRDAMARHAASQMELYEAELENKDTMMRISTEMSGKLVAERNAAVELLKKEEQMIVDLQTLMHRVFATLDECRHCPTCLYATAEEGEEMPEICKTCMAAEDNGSMWEPKEEYTRVKPKEEPEPDEVKEVDEVTEVTEGEDTDA